MAKLRFLYGSMNASKTTSLLQVAFNYKERGMETLILKPLIDDREGQEAVVKSRIGLSSPAILIKDDTDLLSLIHPDLSCVLVDEAQFLTVEQVNQLAWIVDYGQIPVMTYGLRNDFRGELFPASARLLSVADDIKEIKTICWCGKKATHVLRLNDNGDVIKDGPQVLIGGNDTYVSVCRNHFTNSQPHQA